MALAYQCLSWSRYRDHSISDALFTYLVGMVTPADTSAAEITKVNEFYNRSLVPEVLIRYGLRLHAGMCLYKHIFKMIKFGSETVDHAFNIFTRLYAHI